MESATRDTGRVARPKLLVLELWGIGDLVIASPFLKAAAQRFDVTLLAQPHAVEMRPHFWPELTVMPFRMPWTAHRRKYWLHTWPWRRLAWLFGSLRRQRFDAAVSARWDPRDDLVMWLAGARRRIGFPRLGSQWLETDALQRPPPLAHRYERWRTVGKALGLELPERDALNRAPASRAKGILVHSGAGKLVRVWPLPCYQRLVVRLRQAGCEVQVACDPEQANWWKDAGEDALSIPTTIDEMVELMRHARAFVGNDSGPGHVAAYMGVPTFTIFGPQVPEWFVPIHPGAAWAEGAPCPYRPCYDFCKFPEPFCLSHLTEQEVFMEVEAFLEHLENPPPQSVPCT